MKKLFISSFIAILILLLILVMACTEDVVRSSSSDPDDKSSSSSLSSSSSSESATFNVYSDAAHVGLPGTIFAGGTVGEGYVNAGLAKYDDDGGSASIVEISGDPDPADGGNAIRIDLTSDGNHDVVAWIWVDPVQQLLSYTKMTFAIKQLSRTGYQGCTFMRDDASANHAVPLDTAWLGSNYFSVTYVLSDFVTATTPDLNLDDTRIVFGIVLPGADTANNDYVSYLIDNIRFE